jgi:hypothetical protein
VTSAVVVGRLGALLCAGLDAPPGTSDPVEQITGPVPRAPPAPSVTPTRQGMPAPDELGELGLERQADGSYLYRDPSARFTARFQPDGTVWFGDRWKRPNSRDRQNGRCCALPAEGLVGLSPFYGASMRGPLEWFLAAQGQDIYANAKADLMDSTRELRTRLAIAWHLEHLRRKLGELDQELLAAWSDRSRPAAARRELLFRLWDECDEAFALELGDIPADAITTIDAARVATAEAARDRIESFVRRHLPAGGLHAFSSAELQRLNAKRRSRDAFAPYRR